MNLAKVTYLANDGAWTKPRCVYHLIQHFLHSPTKPPSASAGFSFNIHIKGS